MIGLASDKDNSYFAVDTDDPAIAGAINPDHVISLSIHEEAEKIPGGGFQLLDQGGIYSKILRRNTPITVRWGYKKSGSDPLAGGGSALDYFSGTVDRRGFKAIIQDVSGSSSDHGVQLLNANFFCRDFKGFDEAKVYGAGGGMTKQAVIYQVFSEIGGTVAEVDFQGMSDAIIEDGERRDETPFRYLARKAKEWHAIFRIGYDSTGNLLGCFIDPSKLKTSATVAMLAGGKNSMSLKYGSGSDGNVISYDWATNDGENGQGDNVRVQLVNGVYQFQHFAADTETITTWVLDDKAVDAAWKAVGTDTSRQYFLMKEVVDATQFKDVVKYFRSVESSTAPNGYGYVVKVKMFGSIFAVPPVVISFDAGFPPCLLASARDMPSQALGVAGASGLIGSSSAKKNVFYLRVADHSLTQAGYFTDIEVVDNFIMWGQVGMQ